MDVRPGRVGVACVMPNTGILSKLKSKELSNLKLEKIIENWPTNSMNESIMRASEPLKTDVLKSAFSFDAKRASKAISPKFLVVVENQLQRRLEETGLAKSGPSIERLCIFREAFDLIISNFKTYQPILTAIKKEYEDVLQHFRELARELGPTRELLFTVTNYYEQKIVEGLKQENNDFEILKNKIKSLESKIKRVNEARQGNEIVQERLREKLENLSAEVVRESDARKLAILDLNHLRTEYAELVEYTKELNYQNQEGGDPVTLKIALDQAQEAHTKALKRINYLESEYSDVVPKREHELIQNQLKLADVEIEQLKAHCEDLERQLSEKNDMLASVILEKNELAESHAVLQRSSTPRPDWSRVANLVPGGRKRWQQLTSGKSSRQKLAILAGELGGSRPAPQLFRPESRDPGENGSRKPIPMFLEGCTGLEPRILPKRDLILLVEDIWRARQAQLADYLKRLGAGERPQLLKFNEFLAKYLKNAFGVESIRQEWSLSLYYSGELLSECEDIARLRKIVDNEVDEAYHWYLQSLAGRLINQLRELVHATSIAMAMSTTQPDKDKPEMKEETNPLTSDQSANATPSANNCRLTVHQLSIALAKLLQCEPQSPSVINLIRVALVGNEDDYGLEEDSDFKGPTNIDLNAIVCLEKLFHRPLGESSSPFELALIDCLRQSRRATIDHIVTEINRQKMSGGSTDTVTPSDVLEALKVVRPEFEAIIGSSPNCFFVLEKDRESPRPLEDDFAACDLDETYATREEQALAWARCGPVDGEAKNYLTATVHWIFQIQEGTEEKTISLEMLERRLLGANIKSTCKLNS